MINPIKSILKHGAESAKYKYSLIISAIGMVHVCLVILFSCFHILPLVILNIGSVLLYVTCLLAIRHDRDLKGVFYATYLEIIVQSFAATLCIGWHYGFPQYVIALVPFGYYMCHTFIDSKRKYVIASLLGLFAFASFVSCRTLSTCFGALYQLNVAEGVELGVYIFNTFCNFGFLFMVTAIFLVEMQTATNQLQRQNEALDQMASIDPLTGLYNRRSMQSFLNQALETDAPFCLIMCDIDDFKKVNDTYGHDIGDMVLREIAHMIQKQVENQGRACRWGGEELLLLIDNDLAQAQQIAENIRSEVNKFDFCFGDQMIHCSITIGIALHEKGETIDHTITHADNNLYYGKHNGKNRVVSDAELKVG
ncbi:MAG: GGDEF domain-containing protein [Acetatifactor sp.]|nr:GGDEF domain-containing protein [Acetatifactor sp.]